MKKIFLCLIAVIMFPSLVAAQSVSWNFSSRVTIHDGIERETKDIFRAEITRKMIDFGYGDEPALFLRFYDSNNKGAGWYCFGKGHKSVFSRCDKRLFYNEDTDDYLTSYAVTEDAGSDKSLYVVYFVLRDDLNSVEIHVVDARYNRYEEIWLPRRRTDDISPSLVRLLKSAVDDGILREVDCDYNDVFKLIR